MREIKTCSLSILVRTCLLYMCAEYLTQCLLKQMSGRVISACVCSCFCINRKCSLLACADHTL